MKERLSPSLIVLLGAVVVALGAVGFLLVRTQQRMERLEARLARSGATTAAPAPAPRRAARAEEPWAKNGATVTATDGRTAQAETAPPARRTRRLDDDLHAPAQPKMAEASRFAEDNDIDELQWRTLTRLNDYWMDALKKAASEGEAALPDKLDDIARQRDIKLRGALGSDETVARYKEFEGALKENRLSVTSQSGTVYGAAPFE